MEYVTVSLPTTGHVTRETELKLENTLRTDPARVQRDPTLRINSMDRTQGNMSYIYIYIYTV
jgi:hypothetical protein